MAYSAKWGETAPTGEIRLHPPRIYADAGPERDGRASVRIYGVTGGPQPHLEPPAWMKRASPRGWFAPPIGVPCPFRGWLVREPIGSSIVGWVGPSYSMAVAAGIGVATVAYGMYLFLTGLGDTARLLIALGLGLVTAELCRRQALRERDRFVQAYATFLSKELRAEPHDE